MIAQILIYGIVASAIYALLAIGLTLMIGIARVMNLAHGTFYMLGAYLIFTANVTLNLPLVVSLILSISIVVFVAIITESVCLRPLKGETDRMLVMTLLLALLFEEAIAMTYGPQPRAIPLFISGRVILGGISVPSQRLLAVVGSVTTIAGLGFFIAKTKTGGAILTVAQDPEAASLMGVNGRRIILLIHGLAAALAALAGILVAPFLSSSPNMWVLPLVKALTVVILGGLGSVTGSILAACILGFSETIVSFAISPRITELVALVILFLVIILKPDGLMGTKIKL